MKETSEGFPCLHHVYTILYCAYDAIWVKSYRSKCSDYNAESGLVPRLSGSLLIVNMSDTNLVAVAHAKNDLRLVSVYHNNNKTPTFFITTVDACFWNHVMDLYMLCVCRLTFFILFRVSFSLRLKHKTAPRTAFAG